MYKNKTKQKKARKWMGNQWKMLRKSILKSRPRYVQLIYLVAPSRVSQGHD